MGSVSEATQNRSTRSATESESTPRIATGLDFLGLGISSPEVDSTVSTPRREMVVTMYRKATHDSQHCLCRGPRLLGPQSPNKSRRPSGGSRLSPAEELALVPVYREQRDAKALFVGIVIFIALPNVCTFDGTLAYFQPSRLRFFLRNY